MPDLHIREARDTDRDAIREVTLAAYQEYATVMQAHWEDYRQGILATLADVTPAEQFVAVQGDLLVGTVLLFPADSHLTGPDGVEVSLIWPEIRLLAVVPTARGRGVGAALIRECLRRAQRAGAGAVTLHTTDIMRVAQDMYVRMGFDRAPEIDFQPAPGITIKGYRFEFDKMPPSS